MANRDEDPVHGQVFNLTRFDIFEPRSRDAKGCLIAKHFFQLSIPSHFNFRMIEQPVLQDLFGAQAVPAMHQDHFGCKIGQEQCFLNRRVATADNNHVFAAIEEPVTGRTGRDPKPLKLALTWQA